MENKKKGTDNTVINKVYGRLSAPKAAALVVLAVAFVFFVCSQIYIAGVNNSITTEIALADSAVKTVTVDMFCVRDEKIISSDGANVVSAVDDGTRVGASDTVAYSFSDSNSAGNIIRMNEITELLDYYSGIMSQSATVVGDTSAHDEEIIENLYGFIDISSSGNFTFLGKEQELLRDAITSRQTATGVELDLTDTIETLKNEYSALKASTGSYSEIKSGGTGYYISGTDGYENVLDYSGVDEWTMADVEAAIGSGAAETSSSDVGRLVHGYYWYLVCIADTSEINSLKEGSRRTIMFPDSTVDDIIAQVYSIRSDTSGKSVVVFRCNLMNEELASLRCEKAQIVLEEYEGYRVDNNAIRVNEDNETGVYVVSGSMMYFRKVNIVYSTDEYSIVTNPYKDDVTMKNTYMNLYDEYIVEGRDLAHKKIID